ncbi:MAG: HipA N-terminal domain-containing protein [Pseudoflavonifractor sp.]|nr:HipA N-terminal domain-containing protein [Pseudoflavonifractor sp.]
MRQAAVFLNNRLAGVLSEISSSDYRFRYDDHYFHDSNAPAISLTLPKDRQEYQSGSLFPFFFNMLSEGHNRHLQSRYLHIDANDHFGILLATAGVDTPGAVTIKPM